MKCMKVFRSALGVAALLASVATARADFNANKASGGTYEVLCGFSVSAVTLPCHVIVDSTKAEMFKAANPGMVSLTFGGAALTLGQKAVAGSIPVALASEQIGTPADTAWNGTGNPTLFSLWKAIYAQAVQTTAPGGTHTQVIGIEGALGSNPVATIGTAAVNTYKLAASAAGTNATTFAAVAKRISAIRVCSAVATPRFVKIYDKTTLPVPGTDAPKFYIPLPGVGCAFTDAYSLVNGLGIAITTGAADTDTGAVTAGDVYGLNIDTN